MDYDRVIGDALTEFMKQELGNRVTEFNMIGLRAYLVARLQEPGGESSGLRGPSDPRSPGHQTGTDQPEGGPDRGKDESHEPFKTPRKIG